MADELTGAKAPETAPSTAAAAAPDAEETAASEDTTTTTAAGMTDENAKLLKEVMKWKRKAQTMEQAEQDRQEAEAKALGKHAELAERYKTEAEVLRTQLSQERLRQSALDALRYPPNGTPAVERGKAEELAITALKLSDFNADLDGAATELTNRVAKLREECPFLFRSTAPAAEAGAPEAAPPPGVGVHNPKGRPSGKATELKWATPRTNSGNHLSPPRL